MKAPRWAKVTSNSSTSTSWTPATSLIRCRNSPRTALCRAATSALSQKLTLRVVPWRDSINNPRKPSRSRSHPSISSPTMVAVRMSWSPVLTRTIETCTASSSHHGAAPVGPAKARLLRGRNRQLRPDGPVLDRRGTHGLACRRARDDAHVGEGVPADDREAPIEAPVDIRCERPPGEHARRLTRKEAVHPQRHRARRTLRQVVRLQPDHDARRAHEGLPVHGELWPFLRPRDVHTHTPRAGLVPVAVPRLVADPGACADVVEVSRRQWDVDRLLDVTCRVRAERRAVQLLPRRARTGELLDPDDEMVPRPEPARAHCHGDECATLRRDRDARLRPVTPRPHARIDGHHEAGAEHDEPEVQHAPLGVRALAEAER